MDGAISRGSVTANGGNGWTATGLALSATQTDGTQKSQVTDGVRDGTVKASGTAATVSDTRLVTALSPNSPVPAGTNDVGKVHITDGTDNANVTAAGALQVDGSGVTQPVSAASLPLPTGAATSANQTGLGAQT